MAKVLIGIVTYDEQKYCFDRLMEAVKKQTFQDFDILFVDNSKSDYHKFIEGKGYRVIKDNIGSVRYSNIISGRTIIKEEFLKGDWEYLFFLDSDVILPEDAIEKLLSHKKPLISGAYIIVKKTKNGYKRFPCLYHYVDERHMKQFTMDEAYGDHLLEIGMAGLGCCLIHRDAIKGITFRQLENSSEDTPFFLDARKNGFIPFADTSVKCFHMVYPEGDPRYNAHKFVRPESKISFSYTANY